MSKKLTNEEIKALTKGYLAEFTGSENLLVSFAGAHLGQGMPIFEFFNSLSYLKIDKVFFRDFSEIFYQNGVDDEINTPDKIVEFVTDAIAKNNYKKVCVIGNCMGGYASLVFGPLINADVIISFSPPTFLDRINRLKYRDFRWKPQIPNLYAFKKKRKEFFDLKKHLKRVGDYKTEIHVYYSKHETLDAINAERLAGSRNVQLHPSEEKGHNIIKVFRDNGELKKLLDSIYGY